MAERITENAITNTVMADTQNTIAQLANYQEEMATGLAVNEPSDNPDAARQGMRYQSEIAANNAYLSNINAGTAFTTDADNAMTQMSSVLNQAQQAAVQGANGTETPSSLAALGQSVDALISQMVSLGNSQSDGQYIFSGTATSTQPFVESADGSEVAYQGNLSSIDMQVGSNSSVPINTNGDTLLVSPTNVFSTLIQLRDALNSGDSTTVGNLITPIEQAGQQIQDAQGSLGGVEQRLTLAQNQLQSTNTSLTTLLGQTIDADLPTTVTNMQDAETQLQAGLEAEAKVLQPNLLSYLSGG